MRVKLVEIESELQSEGLRLVFIFEQKRKGISLYFNGGRPTDYNTVYFGGIELICVNRFDTYHYLQFHIHSLIHLFFSFRFNETGQKMVM